MSKDVKALELKIKRLEDELSAYRSDKSITKMYLGVKRQVDIISELFSIMKMDYDDLSSKDDKLFDRYFKFLERSKEISETLVYLEKLVVPKYGEQLEHGGILEEALDI